MRKVLLGTVVWCALVLPQTARFHAQGRPSLQAGTVYKPSTQTAAESAASKPSTDARSLLDQYCITCHSERRHSGGITLERIDLTNVAAGAQTWERVIHKLRSGEMPPVGARRPPKADALGIAAWLEQSIDREASLHPDPGRVAIHRLNRTEYANAVRDLLAVHVDARSLLPADDADQQGFDNNAGVLSVSPALLERYMSAAKRISRLAVGDSNIVPVFETYDTPKLLLQNDRMSEDLPFGSRGGMAVDHMFPVDGEYVVKIRLKRQLYDYIIGMGRPHQLDLRMDGKRVTLFSIGGEAKGKPAPATFVGNILSDPEWEKYMHEADDRLQVRFRAKAGKHVLGASFLDTLTEPEGIAQPEQTGFDRATNELYDGNPAIESVSVGGPYAVQGPGDSESRRRLFVCRPSGVGDEDACATKILKTVARHAYRRPVSDDDLDTLLVFFKQGRTESGFDGGIEFALERILAAPDFLFRIEDDPLNLPVGTTHRLSDLEVAARLSFFLWSSIPDDELLGVAEKGLLKQPAVLEAQVRRMLNDPRSDALVKNFVGEWLELGKVQSLAPDPDIYPDFDDNLREAFEQETRLFVGSQIREDHSIADLLSANYTFVNERLARHYQIPNVYGSRFRPVTLQSDERRGLLGQASILSVASYPNRTSPVLRGKWVLDNVLGSPPPPPPPDVPGLKESAPDGRPLSARGMMEQHRKDPACASCHVRMDPLGFALENFDATGKWRTAVNGTPVDASGSLPDGTAVNGVVGLRSVLASHADDFVTTVTQKLLTYAIGRVLDYRDQPIVREIMRETASDRSRWSAVILAIVKSPAFQMRRSES